MHSVVRKSSFSKAQGLPETSWYANVIGKESYRNLTVTIDRALHSFSLRLIVKHNTPGHYARTCF